MQDKPEKNNILSFFTQALLHELHSCNYIKIGKQLLGEILILYLSFFFFFLGRLKSLLYGP